MQNVSYPGLAVEIYVEIMVLVFDLHSERKSVSFINYIRRNYQDRSFGTDGALSIPFEHFLFTLYY